jgi:pyruvate dehydrogenase E2 component (dihydrolipoamide acetyltransferase)
MAATVKVTIPDIGDFESVPVIDLLVAEGESVQKDQPLLVLESDKATMEVPSPAAGVVHGLKVKVGDKVGEGTEVCLLETQGIGNREPEATGGSPKEIAEAKASEPAPKPSSGPAGAQPAPRTAPAAPAVSSSQNVTIPDIGDFESVPVIELLVAEGESVQKDQPLLVLESDKATMEVPSPAAGVVRGLKVKVGDKVGKGTEVCLLETQGIGNRGSSIVEAKASEPVPEPSSERRAAPPAVEGQAPAPDSRFPTPDSRDGHVPPYAGPATRKFARQLGVDLAQVKGSSTRGRIVVEDVQAYVKTRLAAPAPAAGGGALPAIPAQDFSRYGPIETRPLARIRKLSAAHLQRAWLNVPHVTQHDRADITELEAFRKQVAAEQGTKLTLLPFLIKAVSVALKAHPEFNSSLAPDGESLILKQYCHIGFAADTEQGLVVPVVRDVWGKSLSELGADCAELAQKARSGKLKAEEMRGGCFSISSLGGIGGGYFTPIVNAPEVAILGASRAVMEPVWDGKAFQPRLMLPLSLSYDHRVIDGAAAARFIVLLVKLLSDLRQLSL